MPRKSNFPGSTEWLSIAECRRRLLEVEAGSAHLKLSLPKDSPHQAVLRVIDIARYIGINNATLRPQMKSAPIGPERQKELTRFFKAWDAGVLVKALYDGKWQILNRIHGAAPALPPAQKPPLTMKIEHTPTGPKLRSV